MRQLVCIVIIIRCVLIPAILCIYEYVWTYTFYYINSKAPFMLTRKVCEVVLLVWKSLRAITKETLLACSQSAAFDYYGKWNQWGGYFVGSEASVNV